MWNVTAAPFHIFSLVKSDPRIKFGASPEGSRYGFRDAAKAKQGIKIISEVLRVTLEEEL